MPIPVLACAVGLLLGSLALCCLPSLPFHAHAVLADYDGPPHRHSHEQFRSSVLPPGGTSATIALAPEEDPACGGEPLAYLAPDTTSAVLLEVAGDAAHPPSPAARQRPHLGTPFPNAAVPRPKDPIAMLTPPPRGA